MAIKKATTKKEAPKAKATAAPKAPTKKTAVKKAAEPKAKTAAAAPRKAAVKATTPGLKKGTKLACSVCGMVVSVDTLCGCVETCDLICCGKPMKQKRTRTAS